MKHVLFALLSLAGTANAKPIDSLQTVIDHGDVWCSDTYAVVRGGGIAEGGATWAGPTPAQLQPAGDDKLVATHQSSDGNRRFLLTIESNQHLGLKSLAMKLRFDVKQNGKTYSSEGVTYISESTLKRIAAKDYDVEETIVGTTIYGRVPDDALSAQDDGAAIVKKLGLKEGDFHDLYVHCGLTVK